MNEMFFSIHSTFSFQRDQTCKKKHTRMTAKRCNTCWRFTHPVKKQEGPFLPICEWCHTGLLGPRETVLMHIFYCVDHPLKEDKERLTPLDWGRESDVTALYIKRYKTTWTERRHIHFLLSKMLLPKHKMWNPFTMK